MDDPGRQLSRPAAARGPRSAPRLAARRNPAAIFVAGVLVFAGASLVCGLAGAFGLLVAARCVQAVGGALMIAAALDLLTEVEGDDATAARIWATAGVLGAALGPAIGGVLTATLGWEWIFLLQAPIALLPLLAVRGFAWRPLPEPALDAVRRGDLELF